MNQTFFATVQNGLLKPDQPINLPPGARVKLIMEAAENPAGDDQAWAEMEELWGQTRIDGSPRLSRDQLHERR